MILTGLHKRDAVYCADLCGSLADDSSREIVFGLVRTYRSDPKEALMRMYRHFSSIQRSQQPRILTFSWLDGALLLHDIAPSYVGQYVSYFTSLYVGEDHWGLFDYEADILRLIGVCHWLPVLPRDGLADLIWRFSVSEP